MLTDPTVILRALVEKSWRAAPRVILECCCRLHLLQVALHFGRGLQPDARVTKADVIEAARSTPGVIEMDKIRFVIIERKGSISAVSMEYPSRSPTSNPDEPGGTLLILPSKRAGDDCSRFANKMSCLSRGRNAKLDC